MKATVEERDAAIAEMRWLLRPSDEKDPFFVFPKGPPELHAWIVEVTGHRIPAEKVCSGHDPPFQFVSDFFFNRMSEGLVLGPRGGGKTENMASLHLANGHFKPRVETSHIGAVQIQAKRCYSYYRDGLRHPRLSSRAPDPRVGDTEWTNGAKIEILPGTEAQTQGGHPNITTYDELEQGKRQPYENAKSMSVEWEDDRGHHLGQFLATSTRQSSLGLMQRAPDEAETSGTKVYEWCVFETMQPCDGKAGRPSCAGEDCPLWEWCGPCGKCGNPTTRSSGKTVQPGIHGRTVHAAGWRSLDEILALYRRVGRDTWEAQHLCLKPEARSLIYAPFNAANITEDAEYQEGDWHLWLAYDWGFTDPTYIGFIQERDGRFYQFDELTGSGQSERTWVRAVVKRLTELPDYAGPTVEQWERIWNNPDDWPSEWPSPWPEAVGDPSAVQMRAEFKDHGIGAAKPKMVAHRVESGQDVLRAAINSGGDTRRYVVHPRCSTVIKHYGSLRARELADGSFSPLPDPDPANHAFSHGPDAVRYLFWRVRRAFGLAFAAEEGSEE